VSGTLTHGHDFDDSHAGSIVHTSSSVVPTALAVGEALSLSGRVVLESVAAGLEVNARLGLAAGDGFHKRGFHPTGVCGALAASLVAGRLLGLDAEHLTQAVGVAGSMGSGLREAYLGGETWTKRLHPGWAAHAGVVAASLASRGFTGPRRVLEGRFGLYNAMVGPGEWDDRLAVAGLGESWEIRRIGFKPYPCGVVTHPFLDALRAVLDEHHLEAADLEGIHCLIAPGALETVGEPRAEKLRPATEYQAKFSLPFCLAAMAVRGEVTLATFRPGLVRDPAILALADRVTCEPDPSQPYPRQYTARLVVSTRDGQRLSRQEMRAREVSPAEVRRKFQANAGRWLAPEAARAVEETVERLESLPDARLLLDQAARTGAAAG
jgi:2-methylcitrate dehydratase PrpD